MKTFTGEYTTADGVTETRSYVYPVRKLEIRPEECSNLIGEIFEQKGIAYKAEIEGISCISLDLAESYPILVEDIIHNQCRNIYSFNIPREEIFIY